MSWRDLAFMVAGFLLCLFLVHWMNSPDDWDED